MTFALIPTRLAALKDRILGDATLAVAGLSATFVLILAQAGAQLPPDGNGIKPPAPLPAANLVAGHGPMAGFDKPTADKAELTLSAPLLDLKSANPYIFQGAESTREFAVSCLAAAAWYEAGTDAQSQLSVMQVVLNRMRHPSFPKTVCGVVFQGSERATGCQFTFTCDGSLARRFPSPSAWSSARLRAQAALDGSVDPSVHQATHYHADYVSPWWSSALERLAKVGAHVFYRWPGQRGSLSSSAIGATPEDQALVARFGNHPMNLPQPRADAEQHLAVAEAQADNGLSQAGKVQTGPAASPAPAHAYALHANPSEPSGRWAIDALRRCNGTKGCLVSTYESSERAAKNASLTPAMRDRPMFLFIREPASGMTVTLWDCGRAQRPDPAQCLPNNAAELSALMNTRLE